MLNVNIKRTIISLSSRAEIFLILATIFWGGTFPVIKYGLNYINLEYLLFFRFLIASLILYFIYRIYKVNIIKDKESIYNGFILGLIGFLSYFFQTYGLKYTTPARSAFITQLLIIFVFIFQIYILKKKIFISQWISLLLILIGSYFMFLFSLNGNNQLLFKGDLMTLFSAFFFALYIIFINKYAFEFQKFLVVILFHFYTIVFFSFLMILFFYNPFPEFKKESLWSLLYLSIPATLMSLAIMFYFQPKTTPVSATMIYSLEPVFATFFSFVFLDFEITLTEIIGGLFIFSGSLLGGISSPEK